MFVQDSKMKVAWIGPCIGIGGADANMLGLIRYMYNVRTTGIAVGDPATIHQLEWARRMTGETVPFHQLRCLNTPEFPGVNYHPTMGAAIWAACKDADIIVSWCMPRLKDQLQSLDKPVVELAQNSDRYASEVILDNDDVVDFRVACSQTAMRAFPPGRKVDAVIYNGIDPGRVTPRWGRNYTRQMWGLEEQHKVLLYAGRLVDEKFPQAIVEALYELPEEWIGVVVGRGYRRDDLLKEGQRWLGGDRLIYAEPQYHMGDIFSAGDAFILPSDFEGHPLVACEAWLAGVPTVLTEMDTMVELRETFGPLGTYVDLRARPKDLAAAVQYANSASASETTQHARNVAWHEFTLPHTAICWEQFLHDALYKWRNNRMRYPVQIVKKMEPMQTSKALIKQVEVL